MSRRIDLFSWVIEPGLFSGNILRGIRRGTGEHVRCAVYAVYGRGLHTRWNSTQKATTDLGRSVRLLDEGDWQP